ncbi:hypothetical protein ACFP3T_03790 [Lactiplantibacillus dongliensis]|uniref:Uncharacterized protein n=1 Tax=Lactiplantibacillus dongliensis TaxID=2559919 RepID=A0ABW1R3N6_9LACO|nr:hypothetical protein [Lactiplantibacillus dongliensis]
MRLIDFKLSTADLIQQLPLYWETKGQLSPVTDLRLSNQQLLLVTTAQGTPMTLDQLNARTRQVSGATPLLIAATPPVPLFGYRLSDQRLLLG